ncbi:nucleic acid-binding protein [Daldinia bambusicola]|nr:nucleic acid-binding protein [Daldinia bambusicola]
MARPRRDMRAAAEASTTPPDKLTPTQSLARVVKSEGNNLYTCLLPDQRTLIFELAARFRNTIWIRRGGYVLVELAPEEQKGKVRGEIVNVVADEKEWRKQSYWPKEFPRPTYGDEDDEDDEESTVGKMPPSDSEDEE